MKWEKTILKIAAFNDQADKKVDNGKLWGKIIRHMRNDRCSYRREKSLPQ